MKTVFTNQEVTHMWASQNQKEGRNSSRSIFFDGPTIYSYGFHFPMARFIKPRVVLITNGSYSVTTAQHLNLARRAVRHLKTFTVPTFDNPTRNLTQYLVDAREGIVKAGRARTHAEYILEAAEEATAHALDYATEFPEAVDGLSPEHREMYQAALDGTFFDPATVAAIREKARAAQAARKSAEKARQEQARLAEQEDLAAWKLGHAVNRYRFATTALRVRNGLVETTHGATVPIIEARKLYRAIKAGANVVGQRVGHYTVSMVSSEEIVIGCHNIPMTEIERIAPTVLFTPAPAPVAESTPATNAGVSA